MGMLSLGQPIIKIARFLVVLDEQNASQQVLIVFMNPPVLAPTVQPFLS